MLTSQTRPMLAAAALRAIAYARDPALTPWRGPSNPRFQEGRWSPRHDMY